MIFAMMGGGTLFYLFVTKLGHLFNLGFGSALSDRLPALFFGAVAFLLGVIFLITGLLAELIGRNSPYKNEYLIETKIREKGTQTA